MYKLNLFIDSDALIKLAKAGLLGKVGLEFPSFITKEVFAETVIEGKKLLYPDASEIEKLVGQKIIIVKDTRNGSFSPNRGLEAGEMSIGLLHRNMKHGAIVTDDQAFMKA